MIRRFMLGALTAGLFFVVDVPLASPCTLVNNECPPGRIRNPTAGLEQFQDIAYNSAQDFYLVVYKGGSPRGLRLTPGGSVSSEIIFGPASPSVIQEISVAYNPDRNEFLVVWRYDSNLQVWARYLTGDGTPIGSPFFVGGPGTEPGVAYSPASQRYVVVYSGIGLGTHFRTIDGDSTTGNPVLGGNVIDAGAFSARIEYGSVSNKFLIVYTREVGGSPDIRGNFLDGSGFGLSGSFNIGGGFEDQQLPQIGYSSGSDVFMVSFEDWSVGGFPDVRFHTVSSAGVVSPRRNLTPGDPNWGVSGPIGYDPLSNEFIATYFNGLVSGIAVEVSPATGFLGVPTIFGNLNTTPLGVAVRPDPANPQAAVVWRNFLGDDGVHVSFLQLDIPPPSITSTSLPDAGKGVPYNQAIQVQGGRPPLTFSLVSGSPPPGLSGPDPSTGVITGTPTTIGSFTFRVRVEDDEGRADEEDVTIDVTLAPPTPTSPTAMTNDDTPTFQWTASPFATSYNLVVENLTDGGVAIDQNGIGSTSFTPGAPLASGKTYRWKVRSTDGSNFSPFSQQVSFLLDSTPPSTVTDLIGGPAAEAALAGLTAIDSSGALPGGFGPERTLDGDFTTEYTSPGRASNQEEFIVYDLGATRTVGRVRLRSRNHFGDLMPRDFVVEVSDSPSSGFSVATTVTNFTAPVSPSEWFTFNFTPVTGRYLRLRVTEMNTFSGNGKFYVSFTEFEAWQTAPPGSLQLAWTAPDPNFGTLLSYDIRYTTGGAFDYATATPLGVIPANLGAAATLLITGLDPETVHRFGLTATDAAGNVSAPSNVAVAASKGFPPEAVDDLAASSPDFTTIDLSWKAPLDPPSGGAADSYDIRVSTSPITEANFDSATPVQGSVPSPAAPNTNQGMTVTGLVANTLYYFAMRSSDGVNVSLISNVASLSTRDDVPPDPATEFKATFFDDDTADLSWKASGDDGNSGVATSFDVRYRVGEAITEANFGGSMQVPGEPSPGPFGTLQGVAVDGLTPGTMHSFGIRVLDEENNPSTLVVVNVTTLADLAEPTMMTPAPGSTLTGTAQTFQWSPNGLAATQWWLYVGTGRGKRDIHDSGNLGTTTARTVSGLPDDGSTVWVRLWYFAGVWGYEDFQFTAFTPPPPPPPPEVTSPVPGSTLPGTSALFQWTANGNPVTEWWIYAGSTAGANDYFNSGSLGAATQVTVTGLPTNGSTVHVRLWYRIAGMWSSQDFQYTAATGGGGGGEPEIVSPANGSTLGGASVQFEWTANGSAVTEWWLYVGTSSNGSDILNSGSLGAATTQLTVNGLPTDGSQVFVRLWFRIAGLWEFADFQYTATNIAGGGNPAITSPAPGSTLAGTSQLFEWAANGAAVTEWWLYAGSTVGGKQFFDSGSLGLATSVNVTGLPSNGSTIHVRLFYRVGGVWESIDAQYTAANLEPMVTSPAPGSTLGGSSQLFEWTANGVAVTEWWLYAGSTAGASDYFDSGSLGGATSVTAVNLPTDGSTLHVTLWYRVAGLWRSVAVQYTAAGP